VSIPLSCRPALYYISSSVALSHPANLGFIKGDADADQHSDQKSKRMLIP